VDRCRESLNSCSPESFWNKKKQKTKRLKPISTQTQSSDRPNRIYISTIFFSRTLNSRAPYLPVAYELTDEYFSGRFLCDRTTFIFTVLSYNLRDIKKKLLMDNGHCMKFLRSLGWVLRLIEYSWLEIIN